MSVPVIAPPGAPKVVELIFRPAPGAGTPAAPGATPTPNPDLRADQPHELAVQWSAGQASIGGAPPCADPGALTDWDNAPGVAWGNDAPLEGVPAPPGAEWVVQVALAQVGKRYVWGGLGPDVFDCQGLIVWSYAQVGVRVVQNSATQFRTLRPGSQEQIQPGDMVYFDTEGAGKITHVGMLAGDVDGDGTWDMVHAANPQMGVRLEHDLFGSRYSTSRMRGFRTVR